MDDVADLFPSKVKFLKDYHKQLLWSSSQVFPASELLSTLNYFETFLLGILKQTPDARNYSSLDYFELYDVLLVLLHKLVTNHSEHEDICLALLKCLGLALLFVDECTRIELPAILSGLLYEVKCSANKIHGDILQTLFRTVIPMCLGSEFENEVKCKCSDDIPSIITVVLECVPDVSAHFQLIETLMLFKKNLWVDIMSVISFADGVVKVNAVQLLFHYWPQLHPSTTMGHQLEMICVYENISCENLHCKSAPRTNAAVIMLLDPAMSACLSEKAPPLYLCHSCAQNTLSGKTGFTFRDVLLPMEHIGYSCENKHCISTKPTATVTLCSSQCERKFTDGTNKGSFSDKHRNNFFWHILENKGIRYCEECYSNIRLILGDLVTQMSPTCAWDQPQFECDIIVNTVISLLLESPSKVLQRCQMEKSKVNGRVDEQFKTSGSYPCVGCKENMGLLLETQTLSHFGVWILITLCPPQASTSPETATRLIAAVLSWYGTNSKLDSDDLGNRLESLKQQYLEQWLLEMASIHFKAFLSVLLPHPTAESRATGRWDTIKPLWRHYQDALHLITCLASYSIINKDMWDCLIPAWMIALSNNLCLSELKQLKPVLNALLDVDLSPLPFKVELVFEFVLKHFHSPHVWQHEQALLWIQVFCEVDVIVPLNMLLDTLNMADEYHSFARNICNEQEKKDILLLFNTGQKLNDLEVEQIFEQATHSNMTTLCSAFEAMNVSCNRKCSLDICSSALDQESTYQIRNRSHINSPDLTCVEVSQRMLCYVEMMDVVYHQMILQSQPQHEGVCNGEASKIIKLLNLLLTHIVIKLQDNPVVFHKNAKNFEHFFKLFMKILDYILPKGLPEMVATNANGQWKFDSNMTEKEDEEMEINLEHFKHFCLPVQLVFKLVKILHLFQKESTAFDHITHCISKLCLNGRVLQVLSQISKPCIKHFEKQFLFPILWDQLCHMNRASHIVPVLMKGISISKTGFLTVMSLLDKSFIHPVHQIQALLMFTDGSMVPRRSPLSHVIAYSACLVLSTLDEANGAKCTKAMFVLDALSIDNLKVVCHCLQHEFDESVEDRMFVLSQLLLLNKLRPDCQALSCALFSHCMDILAAESVIYRNLNKPFPFPANACSHKSLLHDEELSVQIARARCSINNSRTLKQRILQSQPFAVSDYDNTKANFSLTEQSVNELLATKSEDELGGKLKEDVSYLDTPVDCQTVHHLTYVVCRQIKDDVQRSQAGYSAKGYRTFFRQLQSMLGYNEQIGYFTSTPANLRNSVGVYSMLINLPTILDQNQTFGNYFLPIAVPLMHCMLSPQPTHDMADNPDLLKLNVLPCNVQQAWLKSLLVILYKYPISEVPDPKYTISLILACLQALETEYHRCTLENMNIEVIAVGESAMSPLLNKSSMHKTGDWCGIKQNCNTKHEEKCEVTDCKEGQASADNIPAAGRVTNSPCTTAVDDNDIRCITQQETSSALQGTVTLPNSTDDINVKRVKNDINLKCYEDTANLKCYKNEHRNQDSNHEEANDVYGSNAILKLKQIDQKSMEIITRCEKCNQEITEFNEETLCLCIVNLCELIQCNAKPAVPLLPRILKQLAVIAEPILDDSVLLRNAATVSVVAKQAIRCICHQLLKNAIFSCMFQVPFHSGDKFIPVVVSCLKGYQKVHSVDVLGHTLKGLPDDLNSISIDGMSCLLTNIAIYLRHLPLFTAHPQWGSILNSFCVFVTKLNNYSFLNEMASIDDVLEIMTHLLSVPVFVSVKQVLLEPFSKLLALTIPTCTFSLKNVYGLCSITNEMFNKDKDKLFFTRCFVTKLVLALKRNCFMSDRNLHLLIQLVLLDGGSFCNLPNCPQEKLQFRVPCYAMECFYAHINECLDILGDESFVTCVDGDVVVSPNTCCGSEDPRKLLQAVKLSVAQIIAGALHNKSVHTILPWVFNPPTTMQHGPKEYHECVTHIKKLSWILMGALNHISLIQKTRGTIWQPIPFESGPNLASILQVILTGFLEQNKEQGLNMASLFYVFLFCQIWTVYCEQLSFFLTISNAMPGGSTLTSCNLCYNPAGDSNSCATHLLEFWSRVTPSMLVLLEHDSKVTGIIHRYIASLIACLQKYESTMLFKLYPMWSPMLDVLQPVQFQGPDVIENNLLGHSVDKNMESTNSSRLAEVIEGINTVLMNVENREGLCIL